MIPWMKISFSAPKWLKDAVDKAAEELAMDRSHYIRGALIEKLKADGVKINAKDTHK
jgi:metal-responsive CopG/Arc/MetJ family transcriptional regulator